MPNDVWQRKLINTWKRKQWEAKRGLLISTEL